jgi:hypothetical protein
MAASDAGAILLHYHTFGDRRAAPLPSLYAAFARLSIGALFAVVRDAAARCVPGPRAAATFHDAIQQHIATTAAAAATTTTAE